MERKEDAGTIVYRCLHCKAKATKIKKVKGTTHWEYADGHKEWR